MNFEKHEYNNRIFKSRISTNYNSVIRFRNVKLRAEKGVRNHYWKWRRESSPLLARRIDSQRRGSGKRDSHGAATFWCSPPLPRGHACWDLIKPGRSREKSRWYRKRDGFGAREQRTVPQPRYATSPLA